MKTSSHIVLSLTDSHPTDAQLLSVTQDLASDLRRDVNGQKNQHCGFM